MSVVYHESKRRQRLADAIVAAEADKTPDPATGKYSFTADEMRNIVAEVDRRPWHLGWLFVGAAAVIVILLIGKL